MKRFSKAFTLIELLIVVAIIAILAAIAVPNFLEAQVRAKVSRVKSDLRSTATAIEAYHVDYNHYPFDWDENAQFPYYIHSAISTPVAYMTSGKVRDVFAEDIQSQANFAVRERFRYRAFTEEWLTVSPPAPFSGLPGPEEPGMQRAQEVHGAWFLASKGPDGSTLPLPQGFSDGNNLNDWLWLQYDPTNGTVSRGDVMRSQARSDVNASGYPYDVSY